MKKITLLTTITLFWFIPVIVYGYPTVFPTGTTIYKPEKCWSGYTILGQIREARPNTTVAAPIIDMNGNIVHQWKGLYGFPAKVLPGGYVMGGYGRLYDNSQSIAVVQMDFDGNIVWKFDKWDQIIDDEGKLIWSARQRHDFQREGNPVGYYTPLMYPLVDSGKTMILGHKGEKAIKCIYEVSWDGKILWQWSPVGHEDEVKKGQGIEINTGSWLGPNKWYDKGDERFDPENIITDNTQGDVIFIISKKTGKIVWKVGPDYTNAPQLRKLGLNLASGGDQFVGGMLHHAHMIPKGLPGAGNILVFNNGCPYSLVTEFDPVTLKVVWEYSGEALGYSEIHSLAPSFFSGAISSAQRLPNGNTLICEGNGGRVFEVTRLLETVWEYVHPINWYRHRENVPLLYNSIYRAYRVPYDWVPQLKKPVEKAIIPPNNSDIRVEHILKGVELMKK